MNMATQQFMSRLNRQRRLHQAGLLLREVMRIAGYALIALTLFAAADFFLAFSQLALIRIGRVLLGGLALASLIPLIRCARVSITDYAEYADRMQRSRRQDVLGALELARGEGRGGSDSLERYLIEASVTAATERLQAMRFTDIWPMTALRRQGLILCVQVAVAGVSLGVPRVVSGIVLERIFHPERDRPPYSPYRFVLDPEHPRALYGQSVELTAEITGAPVRGPVWLLTRWEGNVRRAVCFQDSPERFAQRLEQVVQPLEFAFATGRARSEWRVIDVLLDPRIAAARATIHPPTYSGKPARTFIVGEDPLAELTGASATLEIASNRPLLDGTLTLRARDGTGKEEAVIGVAAGLHRIRFDWTMRYPADLTVQIRDVRGTANQESLVIRQDLLPDEAPRAYLTQPGAFALATPAAVVRLAGYAEDDLALRRVELVSGLVGYRDRVERLGPDIPRTPWGFERDLDMARLGVVPGQILEFYLEAQDGNPDWTGVGASEVARIEIIAEEEYAELVRAKLRTEDFIARYRAARETLADLKTQMEDLLEQLSAGDVDAEALAEQLDALKQAHDAARRQMETLSRDFAAFDAENAFHEMLGDLAELLNRQAPSVAEWSLGEPRLADQLERALKELRQFDESMQEQMATAEAVAEVGRVFELTQRYLQLVRAQEQLVRRMDRYPDPSRLRDEGLFESFRREETAIREALIQFREELVRRANALSTEDYEALKRTSLEFAEAIETLLIPDILQEAIQAAADREGGVWAQRSELALERMQELITQCEGAFGDLMQCELTFQVRESARSTLNQMIKAWGGPGMGAGFGDGYSMNANTPLNVPLFGPGRSDAIPGRGQDGRGDRRGAVGGAIGPRAREALRVEPSIREGDRAAPMEQAPEKYRDALRRYFGMVEENP